MRIIITADLHIGLSEGHDLDIMAGFQEIRMEMQSDVGAVFIAGDIFHTSRPTPDQYKFFGDCLGEINTGTAQIFVIDGNHDKIGSGRSTLETFQSKYYTRKYVHFYTDFTRVDLADCTILFAPFQSEYYADRIVKRSVDKDKKNILIGHIDIPGASLGAEREIQLGNVDSLPSVNNVYDLVISGHIHKYQIFDYGKVQCAYPGALSRVSHSEGLEAKGFLILDTKTLSLKFIARKTDRKYYTHSMKWTGKKWKLPDALLKKAFGRDVLRLNIEADQKYVKAIDRRGIQKALLKWFKEVRVNIDYVRKSGGQAEKVSTGAGFADYENNWISKNAKGVKAGVTKKFKEIMKSVELIQDAKSPHTGLFLQSVFIENYQAIASADKSFDQNDCTGIIGQIEGDFSQSNGSGKSSFLEAIRYGLYGETRFSKNGSAIRDGEKEATTELTFQDAAGTTIFIQRVLKESGSQAFLILNPDTKQEQHICKGSREVTKWVVDNLGLTLKMYDAVVYCGQDRFSILGAKATDRLKALQEPLPLDKYKNGLKVVKDLRGGIQRELDAVQGVLDEFDKDQDEKLLEKAEKDLLWVRDDQKRVTAESNEVMGQVAEMKKISDLNDKVMDIDDDIEELRRDQTRYAGRIKEYQKEVDQLPELNKKDTEATKELDKVIDDCREQRMVVLKTEGRIKQLKQKLKDISSQEGAFCGVCDSPLSDEKKKSIKADTRMWLQDLEKVLEKERLVLNDLDSLEQIKGKLVNGIRGKIVQAENSKKTVKEWQKELKSVESGIEAKDKKKVVLLDKIGGKKFDQKKYDQLLLKEGSLADELADLAERSIDLKSEIQVLKKNIERVVKAQKKFEGKQKELKILNVLYDAFSPRGIPQEICLSFVEEINNLIPVIVSNMNFWQDVQLWFEPDDRKATSSITVWVKIGDKEVREFEGLSQGEKEISNLIFREAYRNVLQNLIDLNYNQILIDEALDALDQANLANAVKYYRQAKLQSFCISHTNLQDAFSKTLIVRNENGVTEVI